MPVPDQRMILRAALLSGVFACLMLSVPWESYQGTGPVFIDRAEYYEYFRYETNVLEYTEIDSYVDYFTRELLWHYGMNELHRNLGISLEFLFAVISLICLFTFAFFVTSRSSILYLFFLVNPLLITLAFSQLRSALAFSLLLIASMTGRKLLFVAVCALTMLIHTAMALFSAAAVAVYAAVSRLKQGKWSRNFTVFSLFITGFAISIAIGPVRELILSMLGDRRAIYVEAGSSFLYSSYWLLLWAFMVLEKKPFFEDMVNSYSFVLLSVVLGNVLTGGYSLRFLALGLPLILVAMSRMSVQYRKYLLVLFIPYVAFQWKYWLRFSVY